MTVGGSSGVASGASQAGASGRGNVAGATAGASALAAAADAKIQTAISFALAQIGKPYVWGGVGPAGYDCSGLCMAAYAAAGVSIPHYTLTQIATIPTQVGLSESDWLPGDLIYLLSGDHVVMYLGDNQIVQAPHTGANIFKSAVWFGPGTAYAVFAVRRPVPGGNAGAGGSGARSPQTATEDVSIGKDAKAVGTLFGDISKASFWLRVGMGLGGAILLVYGLITLTGIDMGENVQSISDKASRGAEVAEAAA